MNNLFKRSVVSIALVGAITSSLFGGKAAYVDVRVNYLSGMGKAVLGYESQNADSTGFRSGARKDLVELYIRVLDKDGNFADMSNDETALQPIVVTRKGNTAAAGNGINTPIVNVVGGYNVVNDVNTTENGIELDGDYNGSNNLNVINREVTVEARGHRNAARYTLDYTNIATDSLIDNLTIRAGKIDKLIPIKLISVRANSLLPRITYKSGFDSGVDNGANNELDNGRYINNFFSNIKLKGEPRTSTLNFSSNDVAQIIAGESIPIKVFASTGDIRATTSVTPDEGRFTLAPELNGKKIIVVALGDYDSDGVTDTYLNEVELTMKDGVASGEMVINYGLPDRNSTNELIGNPAFENLGGVGGVNSATTPDQVNNGGLGVALIAYVKEDWTIGDHTSIRFSSDGTLLNLGNSFRTRGDGNWTDAVKVKSGRFDKFKIGQFNQRTNGIAAKLWTNTSDHRFVANSAGIATANLTGRRTTENDINISIVAVDKLGNPASFDINISSANDGAFTFKVNGAVQTSGMSGVGDFNLTSGGMSTGTTAELGIVSGSIQMADGANNISVTQTIEALYSGGRLSGKPAIMIKAHTVDLVGKTPSDVVGELSSSNLISAITLNNGGTTKIYTEQVKTKDYVGMKVKVKVNEIVANNNVSLHFSVLKVEDKTFNSAIKFSSVASPVANSLDTKLGVYVVELNNTALARRVVTISDVGGEIGLITFAPITETNYKNLVGTTTVITLKGSPNQLYAATATGSNTKAEGNRSIYRRNVDAYVTTTTTTENAEAFVNKDSEPGPLGKTQIDFDFSGSLIDNYVGHNTVRIDFSGQDTGGNVNNNNLRVGLLGEPFVRVGTIKSRANTRTIRTKIPKDGKVSVVLYGSYNLADNDIANKDANKTRYSIDDVLINGVLRPVFVSRNKNGLTEAIDIDVNTERNITVEAGGKLTATSIHIRSIGQGTKKSGTGVSADILAKLPDTNRTVKLSNNANGVFFSVGGSNQGVFALSQVNTNKYYSLFDRDDNLRTMNAYGNEVNMESAKISDNYVFTVSDTKCAKVEMASGSKATDPAYIYFETCAAGKSIDLIISVNGNEKVQNTITFTNIAKSIENTKFNVSVDVGLEKYNVANNDVVIKIQGDGHSERSETTVSAISSNKDAIVKLTPILELSGGREFLGKGNGKFEDTIAAGGSYYILTADQAGTITVTATAEIPAVEAKSGVVVPLTGTKDIIIAKLDISAPTVNVASTATSIVVTISDENLNAEETKVEIYDTQSNKLFDATVNGNVYTTKVSVGKYRVLITAIDLEGNIYNKSIIETVGEDGATLEDVLVSNGSYKIDGTFSPYDFGSKNSAHDWAYVKDDVTYQLKGIEATSGDVFGWKESDVTVTPNADKDWSMIKLTGATGNIDEKGPYGWVLVNKAGNVYKLTGVNSTNGTFKFSSALYINVKVDGSNVKFTAKK